jgi:ADP-ribose pyrophosphatase YjhB (NUDIX family)
MKEIQAFHILCKGLVFYRNRFLIRKNNDLEFFIVVDDLGGRVNSNELLQDALKRAMVEEFGLDLNTTEHSLCVFDINQRDEGEYGLDDKTQVIEVYYKIVVPDHVAVDLQPDDRRNFEWVDKKTDIDKLPYLVASKKDIYKKAQRCLV